MLSITMQLITMNNLNHVINAYFQLLESLMFCVFDTQLQKQQVNLIIQSVWLQLSEIR